ncbi:hypothetical protein ES703_59320 [subsurface metagenome]
MKAFCAIYSLRMSFCIVPPNLSREMPRFWALAKYIAQITAAGPLMVIEVVIWSSGMPSNNISISAKEETPTPHLPNSPRASGSSLS